MPRPDLEWLRPARDAEIGSEAISHGGDAVCIGVQATRRAVPRPVVNGSDRLARRFDRKNFEMQRVDRIRSNVLRPAAAVPMPFNRTRPSARG